MGVRAGLRGAVPPPAPRHRLRPPPVCQQRGVIERFIDSKIRRNLFLNSYFDVFLIELADNTINLVPNEGAFKVEFYAVVARPQNWTFEPTV